MVCWVEDGGQICVPGGLMLGIAAVLRGTDLAERQAGGNDNNNNRNVSLKATQKGGPG